MPAVIDREAVIFTYLLSSERVRIEIALRSERNIHDVSN